MTWLPTPENINALPEPVRDYIHELETLADQNYIIHQNTFLKDQVRQLEARLTAASRMMADDHFEYNRKTNLLIRRHAEQIVELQKKQTHSAVNKQCAIPKVVE